MDCLICNRQFVSCMALTQHLKSHSITAKEYYDMYINTSSLTCPVCNSPITTFRNLRLGYTSTCCKKCSAIQYRKEMREDESRYSSFVSKVKKNMKTFHSDMSTETYIERSIKISDSLKRHASTLSKEERVERYGWMNKVEDPTEVIKRMTSHRFQKALPEAEVMSHFTNRDVSLNDIQRVFCLEKNYE